MNSPVQVFPMEDGYMTDTREEKGFAEYKVTTLQKESGDSKLAGYQDLVIGERGIGLLILYELIMTFVSPIPGALGMVLRSKLYPLILGNVGKNVIFGKNIVFRHPRKIRIGDNSFIDDNCMLDAKGTTNTGITLGQGVFIGRNTILNCKDGDIELRDHVNLGYNCVIFSSGRVVLEDYALLAAYCYVVGGGEYDLEYTGKPIALQPVPSEKGIILEANCWLGASVLVLDGSKIGHDSAIGASSLVNGEIPPFSVAVGVPAKVRKTRAPEKASKEH